MSKAILCVDDEKIIITSLVMQLREHYGTKYYYEAAESAEEALEVIDELVSEGVTTILVISDWLMPGIKGDEFLIKAHAKYPSMVKIMLTGQASAASVKNAEENGNLFSYVTKPWDKDYLMDVIDRALEKEEQ